MDADVPQRICFRYAEIVRSASAIGEGRTWQWPIPDVCLPLKGRKDVWRSASGLVRIPEGIDRLAVKVNTNQSETETT